MLIGIMGKMGSGKTLSMSILASYVALSLKVPLYANYGLKNANPITTLQDLWGINAGIMCFDEIWLTMDSRFWSNNVLLTRWINQTRKKNLLVFFTTQHIRQVELRCRNATDFIIYTEKRSQGFWLQFIDYQYQTLGRRFLINQPERFYNLYNTFEVLYPLLWKK